MVDVNTECFTYETTRRRLCSFPSISFFSHSKCEWSYTKKQRKKKKTEKKCVFIDFKQSVCQRINATNTIKLNANVKFRPQIHFLSISFQLSFFGLKILTNSYTFSARKLCWRENKLKKIDFYQQNKYKNKNRY